jgi:hypothetical protein
MLFIIRVKRELKKVDIVFFSLNFSLLKEDTIRAPFESATCVS